MFLLDRTEGNDLDLNNKIQYRVKKFFVLVLRTREIEKLTGFFQTEGLVPDRSRFVSVIFYWT